MGTIRGWISRTDRETPMRKRLFVSISLLTASAAGVACASATGARPGGPGLLVAGLLGLTALTLFSERWRRTHGAAAAPGLAAED